MLKEISKLSLLKISVLFLGLYLQVLPLPKAMGSSFNGREYNGPIAQNNSESNQDADIERFLENNKDNIGARFTLFSMRYPKAVALLDVLFKTVVIICTLILLKIIKIRIPFPVSIVAGMEFASGITSFSTWFYFKNLALLFPGSPSPYGVFTPLITIGAGLLHIFLGILLVNLIDLARIAALGLITITCLAGILRGLLEGFSNHMDNIELSIVIVGVFIYYISLNRKYFESSIY